MGMNGAGKSTTIKCLTGIYPFNSGEIKICGYDITKDSINAKLNMDMFPTITGIRKIHRQGICQLHSRLI